MCVFYVYVVYVYVFHVYVVYVYVVYVYFPLIMLMFFMCMSLYVYVFYLCACQESLLHQALWHGCYHTIIRFIPKGDDIDLILVL